ncbi:actin-binding protein WASF2-like [Eriocheir sinensis]|uniref:actin-binding protein WASF2-like n=1 Tax=Eriocheir sinensis TaxID=95602 RepID=UPI0021C94260|nr:actin-binding protein WASF2-like [Eriocheir sinensis]
MLDLGSWGVFYTRPFNAEPLRCYRCQQYSHHRSRCNRQAVCGMCSGPQMTEAYLAKYKAGESMTALCPNCRQHHHAWTRRCPSRLNIVDLGIQRQEEWRAAHNPSRPAWTGRSRSRSQRRPAPPGQTTLASQEHFPALPPPATSPGNAAPAVPPPATSPPPPTTQTHPASTSTPAPTPRPASASVPSTQLIPALPPPALPQRVRRRRNRGPRPPLSSPAAPLVPPPGHVLVTRAALEGMLASFALALTGLLKLTPDEAALRVIAKATVEECFPTVDSPAASPATPLQIPVAAPPTAQTRDREDAPPPAGEARMEVDAPSQAAVAPAVSVAQPAPATQTAKPRSHIPARAAPTRSRIPQPKGMVTPKRRGPAPSRAAAPVITPGASSTTDR